MKPHIFLPALITGPLLWAAFFPLDFGPLAFIALMPWLTLVRSPACGWRLYLAGYLGGFAFFLPALQWLHVAHPMMYLSWFGLALVCPLFWLAGLFLLRRIDALKLVPLGLSVPVVWVALEYVRAHPTGFPLFHNVFHTYMVGFGWYFLGYTQHSLLPLIQVADLGGVYAVSFLVAAVNGMATEWLLRWPAARNWLGFPELPSAMPIRSSVGIGILLAAAAAYGFLRLDHPAFEDGPRVAALQGNVPQAVKIEKGEELSRAYAQLHVQASRSEPKPDLIVWPETSSPRDWLEIAGSDAPEEQRRQAIRCAAMFAGEPWGAPVLLGLNGLEWDDGRLWKYNTALLIDAHGKKGGRYDKMHLVPFGEYVPFKETLPWMRTFTPYTNDYSCRPGRHWTRFPLETRAGRFTFGCLICYEDSDPYLARQYAASEPVNFLVNISNDGWFGGTEEHEEHLAICRFRAVETRRSIVRAVNMGISCVIDPDGRVGALPAESWAASKKMEGIVAAVVPIDNRESWYARLGDWLPAACWGLLVFGHFAGRWLRPITPEPAAS